MEKTIYSAPQIIRESSRGFDCIPLQNEMLCNREVMLIGEIDAEMANSLIAQLLFLNKENPESEISIYINSPGGEVVSGLALYDVIQAISCPVRMICTGLAASMASVIFASGTTRVMLPHSRLMLHDPLISGTAGSALELHATAENLMQIRQSMAEIYAAHTKKSVAEILDVTSKDTYFDAHSAIAFGLADNVIDKF